MALKFEIVEGNLKITNTENNSVVVLFSKQNIGAIANIITTNTSPVHLYNIPKGYSETIFSATLNQCVDSTETPFTPETFIEFCELNLGFNSPGASGTISVTDSYLTLPAANTQTGKFYWCQNSEGIYLTGLYYSNGTSWETSEADDVKVVANFDALPDPTTVPGQFYWCEASQGSKWNPFTGPFKNSGMYYSNGTSWTFLNVPYQATQAEVNAGLNDDKFLTAKTFNDSSQLASKLNLPQTLRATSNITLIATTASQKLFGTLGDNGDGSFTVEVGKYKVEAILKFQTLGNGEFGFITGISDGISTFDNIMIFVNGSKKSFASTTQSSITTLNESFTSNPMISSTSSVQTGFLSYSGEFNCTTAGKLFPGISLGVAISALFLSNSYYTITKIN